MSLRPSAFRPYPDVDRPFPISDSFITRLDDDAERLFYRAGTNQPRLKEWFVLCFKDDQAFVWAGPAKTLDGIQEAYSACPAELKPLNMHAVIV